MTAITPDVEYVRLLVTASDARVLGGLEISSDNFLKMTRPGWPDEWL